jgi:hypothetical protein
MEDCGGLLIRWNGAAGRRYHTPRDHTVTAPEYTKRGIYGKSRSKKKKHRRTAAIRITKKKTAAFF